jgi:hypothetical protein
MFSRNESPRGAYLWPLLLLILAPGFLSLNACDDGVSPGTSQVQVLLTDAPSDAIESAEVSISRVYLKAGSEEEEGEEEAATDVDLFNDPDNPKVFDLLTLRDGITAELTAAVEIPEGTYRQLRLVVAEAVVTLADPYEFKDGDPKVADLKVPSGSSSGIKVRLDEEIDATEGTVTIIVVDFDVEDNFRLQGGGQGNVINGVIFTPSLHEKGRSKGGM